MRRRIIRNLVGVAVVAALAVAWAPASEAQFYKGKTINVIVGFGPGGIDRMARFYLPFISKYIPGNPNMVVKNMPGAGALKSLNFMKEKARPDGFTVSFNPFLVAGQLSRAAGMRFGYEDFTFLGGLTAIGGVDFVRADVIPGGIKQPKDVLKAKNLKYAGRNPTQPFDVLGTLGLDMLGVDYRYVQGYRAVPKMKVALQQNEMQLGSMSGSTYMAMFKKDLADTGIIVPLWAGLSRTSDGKYVVLKQFGPNVLSFVELYKQAHGKEPSGIMYEAFKHYTKVREAGSIVFIGPPGMNPEATKILTEGLRKAAVDPDLIAQSPKRQRQVRQYISPVEGKASIDALGKTDPKIIQFWKDRIKRMQLGQR